ncbi:MAG: acyloxyacyl hydrolase [Ramlibacter sp.]
MDLVPGGAFVQGGVSEFSSRSLTAGVWWPWEWKRTFGGSEVSGITEAYVSHWSARAPGGREGFVQVGLVPMFRFRPSAGASPWFLEGGIGISTMDKRWRNEDKEFTTRFNFVDVVGFGHSFGADRKHELGLRFSHVSNAGIKSPNPGQNFLQLRYAARF